MSPKALLVALVPAAAVAAGNYLVAETLAPGGALACVPCLAWLAGAPLVLAVAVAALRPAASTAPAVSAPAPEAPALPPTDGALRLLGLLQEEGRLVDFLEEDLSGYTDEQIGSAARAVHAGCRSALRERVSFERVLGGDEGETVEVPVGFDATAIRLSGNVSGAPPFRGVLRHPGWRVRSASLPVRRGQDPHVIAPADVEIA
jgi:hypothetical protein